MGLASYQLALVAAAQRLSNAYGGGSATPPNTINAVQDIAYRQVFLQATGADAFVGGDALVTSTNYGTKVASTDLQPVTLGPFPTGPIKLSDLWVAGAGATVHVSGIPY